MTRRQCTHCMQVLAESKFRQHADGSRMGYCCDCHLAKRRNQHRSASAHCNRLRRAAYAANINGAKDRATAANALRYMKTGRAAITAWEVANPERVKEMHRAKMARRAAALTDGYVRRLITQHMLGSDSGRVPQSLVEAKRWQILIERETK